MRVRSQNQFASIIRMLALFLASILGPSSISQASDEERPSKPNIIIMMVDDMGIGDTSVYHGVRLSADAPPIDKTLHTPHLEEFSRSAIVFTDGYAPASMCSVTRYSLLTGRFAHRSYLKQQGWLPHGPNAPMIQQAITTLPEMMQANGYRTACVGKYHVGMSFDNGEGRVADDFYFHDVDFTKPLLDGPTHHGFDEYFGVPGNLEDPLDTDPRILIRNDRFTCTDRNRMNLIGMRRHAGRILSAPDFDLSNLGALYLREAVAFLDRQSNQDEHPFFLYYVPNANHYQRNPNGDYAVPDEIASVPIKGESRYTDQTKGSDREDMVLENDVAFGLLLEKLRSTDDPRWPGHKLIDNTLIIFTSDNGPNVGDNLGRNPESGGLRGKKAKLWEGGIRVPLIVSWPAVFKGGSTNRSIVSLTDIYATLANAIGHSLGPHEALDSHDVLEYWLDDSLPPDPRPRVFFCHLGPPYLNDALAIRQGRHKLIVEGGLAMPWAPWSANGSRGASMPTVYYDLSENLYEEGDASEEQLDDTALELASTLLEIHNRGYARDLNDAASTDLLVHPGWHNLRNDVSGEVGFEFRIRRGCGGKEVTHLGMWDDHDSDKPVRPARSIPSEYERDQPAFSPSVPNRRQISAGHVVRLVKVENQRTLEIARVEIQAGDIGELANSFRYFPLDEPVQLWEDAVYRLVMTTTAADGDQFHDPASFDGLPPLVHPDIQIERAVFSRQKDESIDESLPAFEDLHESYSRFRAPVGPTLRFGSR